MFAVGATAIFVFAPRGEHRLDVSLVRVPQGGIQQQAVVEGRTLHLLYFFGDPKASDLFYVNSRDFGATLSAPVRVKLRSRLGRFAEG